MLSNSSCKFFVFIVVISLLTACGPSETGLLAELSPTETYTPLSAATVTATGTYTPTATATLKPSSTATATNTPTPSATFTATPKPTATRRPTQTPAPTSTWDRYKSRTLSDIIELTNELLKEVQEMPTIYLENSEEYQYPSRVLVMYTGEFREISTEHQLVLDFWAQPFESRKHFVGLFKKEARFLEGNTEYWIPVQDSLIPYMENEIMVEGTTTIYILWIGASMKSSVENADRVFLLNEFQAVAP